MKVEQIYTGCLAHGAYYIESAREAAIIDPLREVKPYIDMANEHGAILSIFLKLIFMPTLYQVILTWQKKQVQALYMDQQK